jgi:SAM-dependent methyltransferase
MKKESTPQGLVSAEITYNQYAQYYDMMTANHVEDLPVYDQLATIESPPYLEVGCGTGRVLSHLLSRKPDTVRGHYLSGVDVSDEMLEICRAKTMTFIDDGSLEVIKHDFSRGPLPSQYNAAFVTFFTLNYIPEHLQSPFLANIGKSLHPDGIISLDCFYPYLKWHPETANQWRSIDTGDEHVGLQERSKLLTPAVEQREWVFTQADGIVNTITTNRVYFSPERGKSLLETAGFTDVQRVFNYQLPGTDDFTEGTQGYNFVLIARRP